jgi:hypothetical protein
MLSDEERRELERQRLQRAMYDYQAACRAAEQAHQEMLAFDAGVLVQRFLAACVVLAGLCFVGGVLYDAWRAM